MMTMNEWDAAGMKCDDRMDEIGMNKRLDLLVFGRYGNIRAITT